VLSDRGKPEVEYVYSTYLLGYIRLYLSVANGTAGLEKPFSGASGSFVTNCTLVLHIAGAATGVYAEPGCVYTSEDSWQKTLQMEFRMYPSRDILLEWLSSY